MNEKREKDEEQWKKSAIGNAIFGRGSGAYIGFYETNPIFLARKTGVKYLWGNWK
jgi:hypothetical protein